PGRCSPRSTTSWASWPTSRSPPCCCGTWRPDRVDGVGKRADARRVAGVGWLTVAVLVALGATELAAQAEPAGTERIAWLACGGIDPVPEGRVEPDELARSCRGDLACLRAGVEAARIWRDTHPAAYD